MIISTTAFTLGSEHWLATIYWNCYNIIWTWLSLCVKCTNEIAVFYVKLTLTCPQFQLCRSSRPPSPSICSNQRRCCSRWRHWARYVTCWLKTCTRKRRKAWPVSSRKYLHNLTGRQFHNLLKHKFNWWFGLENYWNIALSYYSFREETHSSRPSVRSMQGKNEMEQVSNVARFDSASQLNRVSLCMLVLGTVKGSNNT